MELDTKEGQPSLLILKNRDECQQMAKNLISQAKINIGLANYPDKEKIFLINLADYILERKN